MHRTCLCLVLAAVTAGRTFVGDAHADDAFNPFGEPKTYRPPVKAPPPAAEEPKKPLLAPMDGLPAAEVGPPRPAPVVMPPDGVVPAPAPLPAPASVPGRDDPETPFPAGGPPASPAGPAAALPSGPLGPRDSVERGDLTPVMTGDGSGLPYELWRGLTVAEIEALFAGLDIPPRSPALHALWMRLITAEAGSPAGDDQEQRMAALRAEALDRSGDPEAAHAVVSGRRAATGQAAQLIEARTAISIGEIVPGCHSAHALATWGGAIPPRLKAEAIVLDGYCAAVDGNPPAAGMAAELARSNGMDGPWPTMLDALAVGAPPELPAGRRANVIDVKLLKQGGSFNPWPVVANATPGALAMLAADTRIEPAARIAAAEAAAAANSLSLSGLGEVYRGAPRSEAIGQAPATSAPSPAATPPARPGEAAGQSALERAGLFRAIEAAPEANEKMRLIGLYLDSARRNGFYWQALGLMAGPARGIQPANNTQGFAQTAVEIALAAGDPAMARNWIAAAEANPSPAGGLGHWLVLADLADRTLDQPSPSGLAALERAALAGRLEPDLLHRIVTVLDALAAQIPVPLWDAASRTPQPAAGHLPDTGTLSALQTASKNKEFGHTVLLAMKALGPNGSEGAHLIALGDAIRALKRAGLAAEARALGLEAVFAAWPRAGSR